MKKLFAIILVASIFYSFTSAAVVDDAVSWMYDNGLTSKSDQASFKPNQGLRRDEAAKFYVNFSKLLGKTTYIKTDAQCKFSDINESRSDLKNIVVESCRLGLFQGSKAKFNPQKQITNAQAIAVLIRLLTGSQNEIGLSHRANNYYSKANQMGILANTDMNNKNNAALRGDVGVVLYNGNIGNNSNKNNNKSASNSTIQDCGTKKIPKMDESDKKADSCIEQAFLNCSSAKITLLLLDPNTNPLTEGPKIYYESKQEILGYQDKLCSVKLTYIKSQLSGWDNKSMTCNYDTSKDLVENNMFNAKCTGDLYNAMTNN